VLLSSKRPQIVLTIVGHLEKGVYWIDIRTPSWAIISSTDRPETKMGSTIDCWIEYDEHNDPPFSDRPEVLPLDTWIDLRHAKDYSVFGALSVIRNDSGSPLLFELRGLPENASVAVEEFVEGDDQLVGWLYPDEVRAALDHRKIDFGLVSTEMKCVFNILEFLAKEIGNDRVRFVFEIQ
jgi:hypothetical protein